MKSFIVIILGGLFVLGSFWFGLDTLAYNIEIIEGVPVEDDFTLGPGKTELFLNPGEETAKEIMITNRLGKEMRFLIEIEDFKGSEEGKTASVLLGEERGPYSLRDYLKPETKEFILRHGERMTLPVKISIPEDAEPGGLYGAVIVTTAPSQELSKEGEGVKGQIKLVSRIASLFFVRVRGDAYEEGEVKEFTTYNHQKIYQGGSLIIFNILYQNKGNVHLVPYGLIEIKNILGRKIEDIEVDPYFVMPQSLRNREIRWERRIGLGYYQARLSLNRGYQDIIDVKPATFWILPWKIITAGVLIVASLVLGIWWLFKNVEIRKKR